MNEDSWVIRGTISPEDYENFVKTDLEKIYGFFENKWTEERFRSNTGRSEWKDYLVKDLGLEVLISENYRTSPLDVLLERIYSGNLGADKVIMKDPDNASGGFILMSRDFANKVIVMGGLP